MQPGGDGSRRALEDRCSIRIAHLRQVAENHYFPVLLGQSENRFLQTLQQFGSRQVAEEILERFQLSEHRHKPPAQLSGGQRQRVAIARAISIKPKLLLFDEPTSALDPEMTAEVLEVIEELRKEGRDLVLVTHQMGFAHRIADQIALLSGGRIAECGPPSQVLDNPVSDTTREFLAKILKY